MAASVVVTSAASPDLATVAAEAAVAGALAVFLHEFAGHGGFCLLTGGHMLSVSSFDFNCSVETRWMEAGGTIVNAALGLLAWIGARHCRRPHLRFFLWAFMTLNWLEAAGYFLYSGVANFGDWAEVIHGLPMQAAWRIGMATGGAVLYVAVVAVTIRGLQPFLPRAETARRNRARSYMLATYFAFGILETAAGALNPAGWRLMLLAGAVGSFGGASGLAWGWEYIRRPQAVEGWAPLTRNWGWIAVGVAVSAGYVLILGPSVK